METNLQCPLDPFVMDQLKNKMSLARVQEIENHISSQTCVHPPLKDLILHGDLDGSTPLLLACEEGHIDSVKRIVEDWGVNPREAAIYNNFYGKKIGGATPLFVAAHKNHIHISQYLISRNADVSAMTSTNPSYYGMTPLQVALNYNSNAGQPFEDFCVERSAIVRLLLEHGADPFTRNPDGNATWDGYDLYSTFALINYGINLDMRDSTGDTILHHWIHWSSLAEPNEKFFVDGVHLLIAHGFDLTVRNNKGFTPILAAADELGSPYQSETLGIFELLMERDEIDPNEKIDAMELAGARLLRLTNAMDAEPEKAFHWWKKALRLRENEDNPISKTALQTSGHINEWKTAQQLEEVIQDKSVWWIQGMLTILRIYADRGPKAIQSFMKGVLPGGIYFGRVGLTHISDLKLEILRVFLRFDPYDPQFWTYTKEVIQDLENKLPFLSTFRRDQPLPNVACGMIKEFFQLILAADPEERLTLRLDYQFLLVLAGVPDLLVHEKIRMFLSKSVRQKGGILLAEACKDKDRKTLRFLLHLQVDPNSTAPRSRGNRPLHIVGNLQEHPMVLNGELEREQVSSEVEYTPAQLLFNYGADPHRKNNRGKTPVDLWMERNCGVEGIQSPKWKNRPYWCRNTVPKLSSLTAKTIHIHRIPYTRPGDLPIKLLHFLEKH